MREGVRRRAKGQTERDSQQNQCQRVHFNPRAELPAGPRRTAEEGSSQNEQSRLKDPVYSLSMPEFSDTIKFIFCGARQQIF